jgi:membrane protein YdbS with pleckstrin-like domain
MKCQVCHKEVDAAAQFCQHCGTRLAPADARFVATPPAAVPPVQSETAFAPSTPGGGATLSRGRRSDVPETVIWEGGYSPKAMLGPAVGMGILSLGGIILALYLGIAVSGTWAMVVLAIVLLLWAFLGARLAIRRLSIHYKLTNQMFYHQRGLLRRVTNRIEAIDIDDITYEQGIIERLVNVGTIKITSSDRTDPELWLVGIEDVQNVASQIDKARRAERVRRGLSIEAI